MRRISIVAVVLLASCGSDGGDGAHRTGSSHPPGAEPVGALLADSGGASGSALPLRATLVATVDGATLTGLTAVRRGHELLVAETSGVVRRLVRRKVGTDVVPTLDRQVVLDLRGVVATGAQDGLFDLLLVDGGSKLLVSYSGIDRALHVDRYEYAAGSPVDPSTRVALVQLPATYAFQIGGGLALERSGDVLLGIGDQGTPRAGGVAPGLDPASLHGTVIEIPAEVAGHADEPWTPTADSIVAVGLRNPWRISVDQETGDLYIGDLGDRAAEEIDRVPAAAIGPPGLDFGWPYFEGSVVGERAPRTHAPFVPPLVEHPQSSSSCGVIGGFVYHGTLIASLQGAYVYGDLCATQLHALRFASDGSVASDRRVARLPAHLVSLAQGPTGELYGLGAQGGVYRMDPAGWQVGDNQQRARSAAGEPSAAPDGAATGEPNAGKVTCGIIEAIQPLSEVFDAAPEDRKAIVAEARAQLANSVPALPAELQDAGRKIEAFVEGLDARLASSDYVLAPAAVAQLRSDASAGTGIFAEFARALKTFMASECR